MSATATKGPTDSSCKVIEQLAARPTDSRSAAAERMDVKFDEIHASTTIIERIVNARRGYMAWLALQTATITGRDPAIDRDADASWRAR